VGRGKSQRILDLVEAARVILAEIQPATVRAVCYRLFTLGLIDAMTKNETNKVSTQLTWAREHKEIPWSWIVDEGREPERVNAWENPAAYVETVRRSYRRDRWADQPERIEVWSEKGTVRGTLAPVLDEYGITFRVMHGYGNATALHQAATESVAGDKMLTVFYCGDWDPSGLHMSAVDLPTRIEAYGGSVEFERLALTATDITRGSLPWFPTGSKSRDSRYLWYIARQLHADLPHDKCWELDALSPVILRQRVAAAVAAHLDLPTWHRAEAAERAERESLNTILNAWPGISGQASKYEGRR
jgi:hypothetical protein